MRLSRRNLLGGAATLAATTPVRADWPQVSRVVAVGDVHGDKDALTAVLRMAGLVDGNDRWTGGAAHLVQVGDVPSRGPQTRRALDLLMRLEQEAAAAGGRVHALIGNHDAGAIYGDLRSVLPEEYGEFREAGSAAALDQAWREEARALQRAGRYPADAAEQEKRRRAWLESRPPGFVEHRRAFAPSGPYGAWIRGHNAVVRIGRTLFLHGGISPEYVRRTRDELNDTIRRELAEPERLLPGTASAIAGPLWYRGLAEAEPASLRDHVAEVLSRHGVDRIVIGHTVTRCAIVPRFGSRVVNVDLGLSRFYGRPPACLVLEGGAAFVLHNGARVALPGPGRADFLAYAAAVAAADPDAAAGDRLRRQADANERL